MTDLKLTKTQCGLVWLALRQAEENAYLNQRADIGDALNLIRRELEYKQDNKGEQHA